MPAGSFAALWVLAGACVAMTVQAAAADDREGAQLASICTPCHMQRRGEAIAPIIGVEPAKLAGVLQAFRADGSSNHIMHAVSLSLSDREIAVLADYLATHEAEAAQP